MCLHRKELHPSLFNIYCLLIDTSGITRPPSKVNNRKVWVRRGRKNVNEWRKQATKKHILTN